MAIEVWQAERPKGRRPRWSFRVVLGGAAAFDSDRVSLRYRTRADAEWLAGLVEALAGRGLLPGGRSPTPVPLRWDGDLRDDCSASAGGFYAHAEHLSGPRRGGVWYCQVAGADPSDPLFHTADCGVEPRSGEAARWLCEVVIAAADAGVLTPAPASPV